jgi:hypothetical protein
MRKTNYLLLFVLNLVVVGSVSWFQTSPGYMDADYYFAGGIRLANGYGFSEDILWNYLDDPQGLPHPSHGYWMPLASILAALPMVLFGRQDFFTARLIFIFIAACVSPLSAFLSMRVLKRKEYAFMTGILSIISVFYLPYVGTTDTFGICMLLGIGWFVAVNRILGVASDQTNSGEKKLPYLMLGIFAGLINLTRAEGSVWLLLSLCGVIYFELVPKQINPDWGKIGLKALICIAGYLLVFGPWVIRNLSVFGSIYTPGGIRTLWLTNYDELYAYPASKLNFMHWWSSGFEIAKSRAWAFWQNIQTAFAVQGQIVLFPLIVWGIWRLRRDYWVQIGLTIWLVLLFIMTIIFPYQGARGGFFHTGAALQPFIWVLVPVGFQEFILWGQRIRNWNINQSGKIFKVSLICLTFMISLVVIKSRVIGVSSGNPSWGWSNYIYQQVDQYLESQNIQKDDIVMVNNPPGYYVASGHTAIVIPNEDENIVLDVSRRYRASYLLIESNHPYSLDGLFRVPHDRSGFQFVAEIRGVMIYKIVGR